MTRGTEKKDDRHSHTGMDGAPKKHGAGGKGTWGNPLDTDTTPLDPKDPMYKDPNDPKSG